MAQETSNHAYQLTGLRYGFAKSQGVLVTEFTDEFVAAVYRPDASATAIEELRRYVQRPLRLTGSE